MRAVRIHQFGGPEVLRLETLPVPEPGPGQVLIANRATSVNPVDYKIRQGGYPTVKADQLPRVLGRDAAGTIEALGPGVREWHEGAEVFALLDPEYGGYAEFVLARAYTCAARPQTLDWEGCGATPLAALTAWQGLFDQGGLKSGQRVLIHGASGGVGHLAVQFARVAGATVFATASSRHVEFVRSLGVEAVIDYTKERFEDRVSGVDLVFDLVGGQTRARSWQVLHEHGVFVSTLGPPDPAHAEGRKPAGIQPKGYHAQPNAEQLKRIAGLIDADQVRVHVSRVFPLESIAQAQRLLQDEHPAGKIAITVA